MHRVSLWTPSAIHEDSPSFARRDVLQKPMSAAASSEVTAVLSAQTSMLNVTGTELAEAIEVSRNAAGDIFLNGGAVVVAGGHPTLANTTLIVANGGGGNDALALDETSGTLPRAELYGGDGADTLVGGSGSDVLPGEGGNGRMVWSEGDGSDLIEGGDGADSLLVNGSDTAEDFALVARGGRVRLDVSGSTIQSLDIGTTEKLVVKMAGGNDVFNATGNLAGLLGVNVHGGAGSDVIDGGRGFDRLQYIGADVSERMTLTAVGDQVLITRDVSNMAAILHDVQEVDIAAGGGIDTITVGDMTGTDVGLARIDLSGASGGGDGQVDFVVVNATAEDDHIMVTVENDAMTIHGLATDIIVTGMESQDQFVFNLGDGDDTFTAADVVGYGFTVFGDGGDDSLYGGAGVDALHGGSGDDRRLALDVRSGRLLRATEARHILRLVESCWQM